MVSKEDAKKEVKKLIDKYGKYRASGDIKNFAGKEETTKTTFILPLFKALGWDVYNEKSLDLVCEEGVLRGAVDYAFRTDGQNKFFVEAKPIGSELKKYATQAIEYGVNSGNTWVVLTNFESIIIFNCEWQEKNWWKNALFTPLNYKNYLNKFDLLWLLSKESIINNKLDEYASTVGKKVPRTPIDKELLSKFLQWRLKLSKDISKTYKSTEEVDEFVQKLLIRLLFIKNCEDRDFETNYKLLPVIKAYESHKKGLLKILRHIFDYYNKIYDSSIFEPGEIDKISFDESLLAKIIYGLHFTSDGLRYNFKIIPADVMGNLYEQYLGHILKKTPQRAKLKEGKAHRKEQGVYYTPSYIVDYIVKNTLGELLKDKKVDASKIRVLDPACGSGSFLIKAFQILDDYYKKKEDYTQTKLDVAQNSIYSKKVEILKNNIFGVDLDQKAVEIARLNLLLQIVEKGEKLPLLEKNIQLGNSLIDDPEVVGEDKAFKWEERFKSIMDKGGFDVVIGNPPYVKLQMLDKKNVDFFYSKYKSAKKHYDIYVLFVERGLSLLKEGGILGFILPSKFFNSDYGIGLRNIISRNKLLHKIIDFKDYQVFEGATTYTCLLFLKKMQNKTFEYLEVSDKEKLEHSKILSEDIFLKSTQKQPSIENQWIFSSDKSGGILEKLRKVNTKLGDVSKDIFQGILTGRDRFFFIYIIEDKDNHIIIKNLYDGKSHPLEKSLLKKMLKGKEIKKWRIEWKNLFMIYPYKSQNNSALLIPIGEMKSKYPKTYQYFLTYKKEFMTSDTSEAVNETNWYRFRRARSMEQFEQRKIITQVLASKNSFTLDEKGEYYFVGGGNAGGFGIILKDEYVGDYYFILALLNSKLLEFYLKKISTPFRGGFYSYGKRFIKKLPIIMPPDKNKERLSILSKKQLERNKRLNEIGDKKTDERVRIEEEIKKTDTEIDELVYKIYGITKKEKKIIEESLK